MNNTERAKADVARRMLKGKLPVEEVQQMTGLDMDFLKKLEEEVAPEVREAKILQGLDNTDLNIGEILYDNYATDEKADENY
ncbi:MAG: hypothetical protein K6E28_07935 [Eubacterium sp.]|nr:hypothetical protein [Eubacterium sp.]